MSELKSAVEGRHILGPEYAKAVVASKINLGLLSEIRRGASSGDLITARTFQIPGIGAFMLHERTAELAQYFVEDQECGCFGTPDELVARIRYFLAQATERELIAKAGRRRAVESGYSVDNRTLVILAKEREIRKKLSRH